jgi:hypothetical protein
MTTIMDKALFFIDWKNAQTTLLTGLYTRFTTVNFNAICKESGNCLIFTKILSKKWTGAHLIRQYSAQA